MLLAVISTDVLATITAITAGIVVAGHIVAAYDRARKATHAAEQVGEVRKIVNSRLDAALEQVATLTRQVEQLQREATLVPCDPAARSRSSDAE